MVETIGSAVPWRQGRGMGDDDCDDIHEYHDEDEARNKWCFFFLSFFYRFITFFFSVTFCVIEIGVTVIDNVVYYKIRHTHTHKTQTLVITPDHHIQS